MTQCRKVLWSAYLALFSLCEGFSGELSYDEGGMEADIAARFGERAPRYDRRLTRWIGEREIRSIAALVPPDSLVLDYGCGTGRATLAYLARNCRVVAYDFSRQMLELARQKVAQSGYAERVEFVDSEEKLRGRIFPVVSCIGVLDYYRNPVSLLRTLAQYASPGGMIVATFPNVTSPLAWAYALGSRFTLPVYPRSFSFVRSSARSANLEIVRVEPVFPSVPILALTTAIVLQRQ